MKKECIDKRETTVTTQMSGNLKMKFELMSTRETKLDHYDKRGILWHGFCLQLYLLQNETLKDGTTVKRHIKYTLYLDQFNFDSNKQDAFCIFSLFDATLAQIHNDLPFTTNILLQTDNAKSYEINQI